MSEIRVGEEYILGNGVAEPYFRDGHVIITTVIAPENGEALGEVWARFAPGYEAMEKRLGYSSFELGDQVVRHIKRVFEPVGEVEFVKCRRRLQWILRELLA